MVKDMLEREADPDTGALAKLVDYVGKMVDRAHRHQQSMTLSLTTVSRVMEQMGTEVVAACQEINLSVDTSRKLCDVVERRWNAIRVGAYTAGDTSSATAA